MYNFIFGQLQGGHDDFTDSSKPIKTLEMFLVYKYYLFIYWKINACISGLYWRRMRNPSFDDFFKLFEFICLTNFFLNQIQIQSQFETKSVRQNMNIWIYTFPHNVLQSGKKIMRLFVFKASFVFWLILTHKLPLFIDYFPPSPTDNVE